MRSPEEIKYTLYWCRNSDANNQCLGCPYKKIEDCEYALDADALAYIQQLEQRLVEANKTSMRWISVGEQLPEEDGCVMCYLKDGSPYTVCLYYADGELFFTPGLNNVTDSVTHWMPLPASPEAENADE